MEPELIIYMREMTYDCFVDEDGFVELEEGNELETDLLDKETRKPIGKRGTLRVAELLSGDADLEMDPPEASFDEARRVRLIITPTLRQNLGRNDRCIGRLSYGDVAVSVVDDLSRYRPGS